MHAVVRIELQTLGLEGQRCNHYTTGAGFYCTVILYKYQIEQVRPGSLS